GADERARNTEHLAHPRAAARTLVADHDHVLSANLVGRHCGHGILFALEDAGGTAVIGALVARHLYHTAIRSNIALEDDEPACRLDRIAHRTYDVLPGRLPDVDDLLRQRPTAGRRQVACRNPGFDEPVRD